MTTFIQDVSFVAQPKGQAHDFRNLYLIMDKEYKLDSEFDFSRKPTVDYFFSKNPLSAQKMLLGKDAKGKHLAIPSAVDIGKLTLRRVNATTFVTLETLTAEVKGRQRATIENGVISIGSRTADFWYTVTTNAAKETVETIQIRPPYATKVRELLLNGEDVEDIFDALLQEVLGFGVHIQPKHYEFVTKGTRKPKESVTAKQAQTLARHVFNYWVAENVDILADVCEQARPLLDDMIAKEVQRRKSTGPGDKGDQGDQGEPGVAPTLATEPEPGYNESEVE